MIRWREVAAVAAKDLRIEWRHRTTLITVTAFAVLIQLVFVFARTPAGPPLIDLAATVLWVTMALAAMLVLNRSFLLERENAAIDGLLVMPVERSSIYWGKWLANTVLVAAVALITIPVWVVFYNVPAQWSVVAVAGVLLLAAAGFMATGTLFAAMTARTRYAEMLLPVLLLPFLIPPIFEGASATVRLMAGRPLGEVSGWIWMLAAYDLAFLVIGGLLFPVVVDE